MQNANLHAEGRRRLLQGLENVSKSERGRDFPQKGWETEFAFKLPALWIDDATSALH